MGIILEILEKQWGWKGRKRRSSNKWRQGEELPKRLSAKPATLSPLLPGPLKFAVNYPEVLWNSSCFGLTNILVNIQILQGFLKSSESFSDYYERQAFQLRPSNGARIEHSRTREETKQKRGKRRNRGQNDAVHCSGEREKRRFLSLHFHISLLFPQLKLEWVLVQIGAHHKWCKYAVSSRIMNFILNSTS